MYKFVVYSHAAVGKVPLFDRKGLGYSYLRIVNVDL